MWFVFQIGAREHYAIPRALHASGALAGVFTDFWVPPGSFIGKIPGAQRLRDRWHPDLAKAPVHAPNLRMLAFEMRQRLAGKSGWDAILARNELFQECSLRELAKVSDAHRLPRQTTQAAPQAQDLASSIPLCSTPPGISGTARRPVPTVFSYSYAALEIFRDAKSRGWQTVLGQIDPGPEEERIVADEHRRYSAWVSHWQPAPPSYWEKWRQEIALADRIIVNSEWSRQCLLKEGVPTEKMQIVPLVYGERRLSVGGRRSEVGCPLSEVLDVGAPHSPSSRPMQSSRFEQGTTTRSTDNGQRTTDNPFQLLFLGQINLRKGIGRLLDAMRLLKNEPVELTLAGATEIDPLTWADLPKVRWIGPVPRSEVDRHYAAADLFILPTLSDGYAITQLEALAHGLPVLASKCCGDAVTPGQNGWILENLEPETLDTAIRRAMCERLSEVFPPEFSLNDLAAALL